MKLDFQRQHLNIVYHLLHLNEGGKLVGLILNLYQKIFMIKSKNLKIGEISKDIW